MKKSAATNNMVKGRRILADNNKNTALKKAINKQPVEGKRSAPASETVTLTQSEFDAIIGAVGKLSMEKGEYAY